MKKILIVQGHPDSESYNTALAEAYKKGAENLNATIKEIVIRDLDFNPNLQFGYRKRTELEPDLLAAWEKIQWAEHIVWIYPVWWGSMPAIMKGFIDRLFLPGFAFQKRENSVWWDKLLVGKSARIITTLDQPKLYFLLRYKRPSYWSMKHLTLNFVGIKPVKSTTIGPIRLSTDEFRAKWLTKIERLGQQGK